MPIEFDAAKREITLKERGLDFARAAEVFAGKNLMREDQRQGYGERRYQTVGWLDSRQPPCHDCLYTARRVSPHYFHEEDQ